MCACVRACVCESVRVRLTWPLVSVQGGGEAGPGLGAGGQLGVVLEGEALGVHGPGVRPPAEQQLHRRPAALTGEHQHRPAGHTHTLDTHTSTYAQYAHT